MSTNKVTLTGRLIKEAELKFTSGKGTAVATFTLAVDDGFGDKKSTDFIPVVVWGKSGEAVANYTSKGSRVLVNGRIKTRNYEGKNGKVYVTEVVADMFGGVEFLDSKTSSGSNNGSGQNQQQSIPSDYFGGGDMTPADDVEMPF